MKIFNKISVLVMATVLVLGLTGPIGASAATTINLGTADNFAVLGGSTITNTGSTIINGDLGLSPGTSVTGFPPGVVNGTQHLTDPTASQAQADLTAAYNAAGTQVSTATVSGDLGGQTLAPGVYNSTSSLGLTGVLTLDGQGNQNAVFIFQIGSALTTASSSRVNLINGAQACNVFWRVASSATFGTNSNFAGNVLVFSSVTATTGVSINGRVLARNGAVTLDTAPITKAVCLIATPVPTPTPTPTPTSSPQVTSTPALTFTPTPTPSVILTATPVATATPIISVSPTPSPSVTPVPLFPNTGTPPDTNSVPWNSLALIGVFLLTAVSITMVYRLNK